MRASSLVLTTLLLSTALAGCMDPFFGNDDREKGDLVRLIRFTFDDATFRALESVDDPDAFFRTASETFFTYTHTGPDAAAAALTATFVDGRGRDVEKPLSDFTTQALLSAGDEVVITGAAPYSTMRVSDSLGTIAERRQIIADWFTADGIPLPLAAPKGSAAAWSLGGDATIAAGFDHAGWEEEYEWEDYSCDAERNCTITTVTEYEGQDVDDLDFTANVQAEGAFSMAAIGSGSDTNVDFDFDGSFTLGSTLDGLLTAYTEPGNRSDEESGPFGWDFTGSLDGEGMGRLVFDRVGELTATGSSGSFSTSASAKAWWPGEPKSSAQDIFAGEDMPAESMPYEEYEYHGGGDAPGIVADLIADIYGMTLVPGDAIEIVVAYDDGELSIEASAGVVVVAREKKVVEAGAIDSLRIETAFQLEVTPAGGSPNRIGFAGLTHWVHAETYLPVMMQQTTPEDWPSDEEIQEMLDAAATLMAAGGDLDGLTLPTGAHASIDAESTLELTNLIGKARIPAVLSLTGVWSAYSLPVSAMMFGAVMPGYGYDDCYDCWEEDYEYYEEPSHDHYAPAMSFSKSSDRVQVVSAESHADWSELRVRHDDACTATLHNGSGAHTAESGETVTAYHEPVQAGDYVTFEGTGTCHVSIIHAPTNTLMAMWTFEL